MAEKISVQIALEGGAQVEKQLVGIGEAGQTMAGGIAEAGKASQTAGTDFDALIAATDRLTEATNKTLQAQSGLSLQTVKTTAEIAKYTVEIGLTGVEIVQAVRHHDTLIQSLIKLAGVTNTTIRAVSLLTPELALVGVTIGSTAAAVVAGATAFEAAEKVVTKFAASTEKINHTLQTLAATSGESFDKLQRGEAAFEQIGIKAETFRSTIAKINETLAGTEVTNLTKGMKDIVALVNQIAAGEKGITFADWVTAEDKIKGVSIAMKQAADAGKNATQVLLEFLRSADLATSIKVGAAFGLSEADVDRVRRLKGDISDLIQRIQGAGVLISPESAAAFDAMRTSIQNADSAWVRFKQSLDSTVFTTLAANFSSTMNDMKAAALNGAAAIVEALNQAARTFAKPPPEFTAALTTAGQQLQNAVTGLNSIVANLVGAAMRQAGASEQSIKALKDQINGVTQETKTAGQTAQQTGLIFTQWGTVASQGANTAKAAVQDSGLIFTQWGTVATKAGDDGKAAFDKTATAAQSGSDKVAAFASQITGISWETISSLGVSAWNALTGAIQGAIDKLLVFLGLKSQAGGTPLAGGAPTGGPGGGIGSNAAGGLLGGRGSGTSDSNLAWVSRGEHIMPARAVAQPGVLAFLEALRRSGGNLSHVLDGMGRFALGGMIPRAMPAFASGGLAGGMSNVTIQFPGLPAIGGLRASSDVVEQLHRAAAMAQVRSGGRKPSRYS